MALKTDYRDALYDGARKYRITENADGTSGIADETKYTQEGDSFGANDINSTNEAVNRLNHTALVTLTAAGWTGTAVPYTQTIAIAEVTAEDVPVIGILIAEGTTAANVKLQNKAWACVDRAVTGAGTITFYCYNKKPAADFKVSVKGV